MPATFSMRRPPVLVVVCATLFVVAATFVTLWFTRSSQGGGTVEVTGTGIVSGEPDTLNVDMAVSNSASSASGALDRNDSEMAHLESVLRAAGVGTRNLTTSNLTLSPNYGPNGNVTGYGVEDDLAITFHDLGRAGAVIDAAAHAVGNDVQIQGINFSISNTSSLTRHARAAAMRNAQDEASELASAGGETLGSIVKITDTETTSPPPPLPEFRGATTGAAAVPLESGSEQISVSLDVIYRLG